MSTDELKAEDTRTAASIHYTTRRLSVGTQAARSKPVCCVCGENMRLKAVPQECDQCPLNIYFIWNPLFVFLCVEMPQINFWGKIWKILNLIGCLIWFNQSYDTRLAAVSCQLELAVAKHYKRWSLSQHWNHCQILPDFLRNTGIVTFDDTQFGFIKREKVEAGSHEMLGRAGEAWNIPNH